MELMCLLQFFFPVLNLLKQKLILDAKLKLIQCGCISSWCNLDIFSYFWLSRQNATFSYLFSPVQYSHQASNEATGPQQSGPRQHHHTTRRHKQFVLPTITTHKKVSFCLQLLAKLYLDSKISVNTESYLLGSLFGYGITINWEFGIIDDHALFRISWKKKHEMLLWTVYSILKLYLFLPGLYPKFRVFTCVVCFFSLFHWESFNFTEIKLHAIL